MTDQKRGTDQMSKEPRDQRQHSGDESEPLGDLGHKGKTWTPDRGEQGISNRADDEDDNAIADGDDKTRE